MVKVFKFLFPHFKLVSITMLYFLICVGLYVYPLFMDLSDQKDYNCMLYLLGAKYLPNIQNGEIWRLVFPMVLHGGIDHIGMNMIVLAMLGFACEHYLTWVKYIVLIVVGAVGGNIFSAVF